VNHSARRVNLDPDTEDDMATKKSKASSSKKLKKVPLKPVKNLTTVKKGGAEGWIEVFS
jgi:hypothetical protein